MLWKPKFVVVQDTSLVWWSDNFICITQVLDSSEERYWARKPPPQVREGATLFACHPSLRHRWGARFNSQATTSGWWSGNFIHITQVSDLGEEHYWARKPPPQGDEAATLFACHPSLRLGLGARLISQTTSSRWWSRNFIRITQVPNSDEERDWPRKPPPRGGEKTTLFTCHPSQRLGWGAI